MGVREGGKEEGREGGKEGVTFPPLVESITIAPPPFAAAKAR